MKALVFGEVLWDIIEGQPHLGGAPLNFAAHVQQCGQAATLISAVGKDELGATALRKIEDMGLDISMIQVVDVRTGYVPVTLTDGQPAYEITTDVAYDYIHIDQLNLNRIAEHDTFYFGSIIQRDESSRKALYRILDNYEFSEVFYDVNLRKDAYTKEVISKSLNYCTVLKVNDEEVDVIGPMIFNQQLSIEEFSRAVPEKYPKVKTVITTAGGNGCFVFSNGKMEQVSTEKIIVIDTVGAGDSFSAAFMSTLSTSGDPIKAARIANKIGGFVASNGGPIPNYSREIIDLLKH